MIYAFEERAARVHETCFIADSAAVIGSVVLGEHASVWFGAVLRGDSDLITIGARTNIQDGAVLHTDAGIELSLAHDVTVGHQAMLHGCTVGPTSLIGIGSIVLNRAVIGRHCIIGAGALVPEGKVIPDRSLVVGMPGRVIRSLTDEEVASLEDSARFYVDKAQRYSRSLRPDLRFMVRPA